MERKAWARAWRPQTFADVCGHQDVIKALQSSLAREQLHHAYLLTGTRGVGKTTIARLLAKALNCEQGVAAEPCNACGHCEAITRGDFADVLEIDAASRTRVEETRELLDNVPFRPLEGRYKVYVIDEVHMLSTHSFNALLKTLEEPPAHVKFILATTDPQKLPATVVSRCLRFHLKSLAESDIQAQLIKILDAESIQHDANAVQMVAQAGQGSLRDALSLLEQVVMLSGDTLHEANVAEALGLVPSAMLLAFLDMLAARDFAGLSAWFSDVHSSGAHYKALLKRLIACLHELCLFQMTGQTSASDYQLPIAQLQRLAPQISPTDVQLLYEALIKGLDDLSKAPSERLAFEMAALRGIFFIRAQAPHAIDIQQQTTTAAQPATSVVSASAEEVKVIAPQKAPTRSAPSQSEPQQAISQMANANAPVQSAASAVPLDQEHWNALAKTLPAQGIPKMVLLESCFASFDGKQLTLSMDKKSLPMVSAQVKQDLQSKLSQHVGQNIVLAFVAGATHKTPRAEIEEEKAAKKKADEARFVSHPTVKDTLEQLNGKLDPDSIRQSSS